MALVAAETAAVQVTGRYIFRRIIPWVHACVFFNPAEAINSLVSGSVTRAAAIGEAVETATSRLARAANEDVSDLVHGSPGPARAFIEHYDIQTPQLPHTILLEWVSSVILRICAMRPRFMIRGFASLILDPPSITSPISAEDVAIPLTCNNVRRTNAVTLGCSLLIAGLCFGIIEQRVRGNNSLYPVLVHSCNALAQSPPAILVQTMFHFASNTINGLRNRPDLMASITTDVCLAEHSHKHTPTQSEYKAKGTQAICVPKFGTRCMWGIADYVPTVFRNCHHNEKVAMEGRVGKALPIHASSELTRACTREWGRLSETVLPIYHKFHRVTSGMDFEEWVQPFPPGKREMFRRLNDDVLDEYDNQASSFIKREKAIRHGYIEVGSFLPLIPMLFKDPRFIQGCPPEMSLLAGPHMRLFSKRLRDHLAPVAFTPSEVRRGKQIVYTCGRTAEQVGDYLRQAIECIQEMCPIDDTVIFFEDDQSRFDLHMRKGAFTFLDKVYKRTLTAKVRRVLRRSSKSRGRSSLGTKYQVPYTMQSGWPDTSCGDTTVNSGMKYYIHGIGRPWISIINGDDSVTVTLRSEILRLNGYEGINARYASLGMEITAEVTDEILDTEFCSGTFRPCNGTYILFPKIGNILAKMLHDTVERTPDDCLAWCRGIAATLAHFGLVDPLCAALSIGIIKQAGTGPVLHTPLNPYKSWPHGTARPSHVDVETFYNHRYGFGPADIKMCCDTLMNIKLYELSQDPLLRHLTATDQDERYIPYCL
jgi:hypothetical protein